MVRALAAIRAATAGSARPWSRTSAIRTASRWTCRSRLRSSMRWTPSTRCWRAAPATGWPVSPRLTGPALRPAQRQRRAPRGLVGGGGQTPPADINPTAAIVGLLLKHGIDHPWVAKGEAYCWSVVEGSQTEKFHDLMPMIGFLEHTADRARAETALAGLAARIPGLVELDVDAVGYVKKPLDWAPSPLSFCHQLFPKAVLGHHLAALEARQAQDGGWPISWETVGPGPQLEYRGVVTVAALRTLQAYGAL
uniref:Uncharacterized protein n=1 Tax=Phenylobacterium glaciei TaxID=2803784 RepID=A0A974SA82_9CAUL|nr:hypothetical protein JKL49_01600 [Phenylobacterium glaciei]